MAKSEFPDTFIPRGALPTSSAMFGPDYGVASTEDNSMYDIALSEGSITVRGKDKAMSVFAVSKHPIIQMLMQVTHTPYMSAWESLEEQMGYLVESYWSHMDLDDKLTIVMGDIPIKPWAKVTISEPYATVWLYEHGMVVVKDGPLGRRRLTRIS